MADTKKYLHNLDVVNNKVMNLLLNPLTTAQRTAVGTLLGPLDEGYVCFDTTLNQQYFWDGAAWIVVGGSTTWGAITGTITSQTDLITYLSTNYYPLLTNPANYIDLTDLSAGTGISYNNLTGVITNSAPDQTVVLNSGTGISTSGTYPNFTITNTAPDQVVSLGTTGSGLSVTGSYPSFTLQNTLPDQTVALTPGTGIGITGTYPNFTISNTSPSLGGTVTSVGLSMPLAFTVTNSPVTTSGTLTVTGAGLASQYIRGDGTLANFPANPGGGSSVSYYLNGSVNQGTFGGNTYYQMSKIANTGAAANFTLNANGYIANFITDVGDPALLNIPAGNWDFQIHFSASSSGGSPQFYTELYKYNGTSFTLISSGSTSPQNITNGTFADVYVSTLTVPATTLTLTDRLAVRIYVIHSGRTITMYTQDNKLAEIHTTFSTGLAALNGLTAQIQYFSTGTTGTDFNISSVTDTHTFNLPTASAINTGKLSSSDWSTFNNKVTSLSAGTGISIGGSTTVPIVTNTAPDQTVALTAGTGIGVSGTYPNFTITNTSPSSGGTVTGSGTTNYVSKWSSTTALANSQIFDNGTNVGIGTASPSYFLDVNGNQNISGRLNFTNNNQIRIGAGLFTPGGASTGVHLISIGDFSTYNLTSTGGNSLVAIGYGAGADLTSGGINSVHIGRNSGRGITIGGGNTFIGMTDATNIPNNTSHAIHIIGGYGYESNNAAAVLSGLTSNYAMIGGGSDQNQYINNFYLGAGPFVTRTDVAHLSLFAPSANGSDLLGSNFTINAGRGTGTGTPGDFIVRTSTSTTSGNTVQTLTERLKVAGGTGNITASSLSGVGTRMVVADATGLLSTQTIPSGGGGTVTSVAALTLGTTGTDLNSTVANSTTTPVITLNVPTASATNRGALSSADWSTFNNKQKAITSGTAAPTGGVDGDIYLQYV